MRARRQFRLADRGDGRIEGGDVRERQDDRRGRSGERRDVGHDLDAGAGRRALAGGVDVETEHAPAGRREVTGERATHVAEADDADRTFAPFRPLLRFAIYLRCSLICDVRRKLVGGVLTLASTVLFRLTEYPPQVAPIRPSSPSSRSPMVRAA